LKIYEIAAATGRSGEFDRRRKALSLELEKWETLPGADALVLHIHLMRICLTLITACSVLKEKSFLHADSLQLQKGNNSEKAEA
jgi:hypothetical protein